MIAQFNVSIDPGLSACGFAVWYNRECLKTGTLRPPKKNGKDDTERFLWLRRELEKLFSELDEFYPGEGPAVNTVAIETFQGHTHRPNMLAMMKCSVARGICLAVADSFAEHVISVNKKTSRKSDAAWLAKAADIKGSEHARDSYQIGIIAGFDRS